MRRLVAILLPVLLLLTACGGSSSEPEPTSQSAGETAKLDSIKLTDNGDKKAPGVEFAKPLEVAEPTIKVVTEGSGDAVKADQVANLSILALNASDGSTLQDTFPEEPQQLPLDETLKTQSPIIYNAFVGVRIGSTLAYAVPAQDAPAGGQSLPNELLVIKVLSASDVTPALEKPEGEPVTPPAGLPAVTENSDGVPEISVEGVAAPAELVSQDLIKGTGATVKAGDQITVNYAGVRLADGNVFDASYGKGKPFTTVIGAGQVIPGWDEGLVGKTVGSRVLLVIPKAKAYPDATPENGRPEGDLVFVVDILGAK